MTGLRDKVKHSWITNPINPYLPNMQNPYKGLIPSRIRFNEFVAWSFVIQGLCGLPGIAQNDAVPVFTSGQEGHRSYRIPAIISLPDGQLLAFCEGRVRGSGDFGDINIVMKKSQDRGHTWSSMLRISRDEGRSCYKNILIDAATGEQARDHAAYSDLVKLDRKTVGVLYERLGYSQIVFRAVNWKKDE